MQNKISNNDEIKNKLTIEETNKKKFYNLVNIIRKTSSIEKKLELFFKHIPVVFWQPKPMKEILGPFATLIAFEKFNINNGSESYPGLNMFIETKKGLKNIEIGAGSGPFFEILNSFLKKNKVSLSDLNISHQEICDDLNNLVTKKVTAKHDLAALIISLIKSEIISNIEELKMFHTDDTENIIGEVICNIVFENLDVLYESDCKSESELVKKFKIPDWLMDCIFENYMERYMKKGDNKDYTFLFSYEINNEKEKWLEKVIVKTVQNIEINPIRLAEYFSILGDDKFDLDPKNGGFISKYYDDNVDPDQMEEIDRKRYFWFYMRYIRDEARMKNCDKDKLGVLFLTLLGKGIIYDCVADCFEEFLLTLNPTEEQIKNAFIKSFLLPEDKYWLYDCVIAGTAYAESMCLISEKFFRAITFAVMSTMDIGHIEDLLLSCFSGIGPYDIDESDVLEGFLSEESKPRLKILLDNIDKLKDKQKLMSIVALAGNKLHIIDKVMMQEKIRSCFDSLLDTYVRDNKKTPDVRLLYKIIERADTLGLVNDKNKCVRTMITQCKTSSFKEYYYKNQLQQLDSSKLKKETCEKTMPALDEKNSNSCIEKAE